MYSKSGVSTSRKRDQKHYPQPDGALLHLRLWEQLRAASFYSRGQLHLRINAGVKMAFTWLFTGEQRKEKGGCYETFPAQLIRWSPSSSCARTGPNWQWQPAWKRFPLHAVLEWAKSRPWAGGSSPICLLPLHLFGFAPWLRVVRAPRER